MHIRLATLKDADTIECLMKQSMKSLGEGHYSPEQVNSTCQYVCVPDLQIIQDDTYYVVETESGLMVGCGGWSFRNTLYAGPEPTVKKDSRLDPQVDSAKIRAMFVDPNYGGKGVGSQILNQSERAAKTFGFKKGALGATLSGLSFYKAKGWIAKKSEEAILPDGIQISVVQMVKDL